jgi:glycosyltransferase involved in cell wall biosynthesis
MSVTWILHNYPPVVLGGAEFVAHRLNLWLVENGWKVHVHIVPGGIGKTDYPSSFEGINIYTTRSLYDVQFEPGTLLCSQLWAAKHARNIFEMRKLRYIEFVHYVDATVISRYPWSSQRNFTMVYNSEDTKTRALEIAPWMSTAPHKMLHPPIWTTGVSARTNANMYPWITLVNFSLDKGADIMNALAATDTDTATRGRSYTCVKGAHGEQLVPAESILTLEPTLNMNEIWAKTRILIVPSKYETWSMVATEAMAQGIPVVAADHIPALKENCGDGAIYVKRDNICEWIEAFNVIESQYPEYSNRALRRVADPKLAEFFSEFAPAAAAGI